MFAAHSDQENFVHGQQQVAASKPLNHSMRGAPPKTPGAKYPKTPLKIPLQDENGLGGFGGGKTILGTKSKALENLIGIGKNGSTLGKDALITPGMQIMVTSFFHAYANKVSRSPRQSSLRNENDEREDQSYTWRPSWR